MKCQYVISEMDTGKMHLSYGACGKTATHKIIHPYIVVYVCEEHAMKWQGENKKLNVERL